MEAAGIPDPKAALARVVARAVSRQILWILLVGALAILFVIDPSRTADATKTGLSTGSVFALIALGYTLVYGIIELINFAHGDVFMLGSFIATAIFEGLHVGPATSIPVVVLVILLGLVVCTAACGTLNVMIERVAYRPLRGAPKLAPLITAIGMSFILQNVGLLWHSGPEGVPDLLHTQQSLFTVFGVTFSNSDVFAVGVTVPLLLVLLWFVGGTRYGKAMRATAQDADAARLMGIDVDRTISLTFLIGGLMAGAGGLISALYNANVRFDSGYTNGLIAFTAAVMGGIGNLKGAVLGGLLIGIIQSNSDALLGQQWQSTVVFGILIGVMVLRPQGLLGEQTREG
jgi:branched-chain amino acid transport system permease protein